MRGASAGSLATLRDDLDAAIADGADAPRLGDDLFAVSAVLRGEPGLRRVVTDVSLSPESKSTLVRQLFADQLGDASLGLVARAAELRWAGTRDLGDVLEQLGVVAVVKGADEADVLEDELFGFGQLVSQNHALRDALSDPARSVEDKRALLRGLLADNASPATIRLAEQSVSGVHRTVNVAVEAYQKVAAEVHSQRVATVRVAFDLTEEDLARLSRALESKYDRKVHLNVLVDPDVVGGMRVEIGDDVIDGTVSSRLDDARRRLAG